MMHDDKEILIIDPEELELELNSDSPYCTTTTSNVGSYDANFTPHKKIYIPSSPSSRNFKFWKPQHEFSQRISTISFAPGGDQYRSRGGGSRRLRRFLKHLCEIWLLHWRMILSSSLTVISSSACLISFPLHLEQLKKADALVNTNEGERIEARLATSDGFSACFAISTILVVLFLLTWLGLKLVYWGAADDSKYGEEDEDEMRGVMIRPRISWKCILKIGFSVGLSVLSVCSAWEDNKVVCNLQDPLLGIVVIFAIITYAISKWKHFGLRRAFALASVSAGVFVSVIYTLVDHHRCRGTYYATPQKDIWSWKVHFVWTLAFVIAIWLWTVAMFCLESAVPLPMTKCRNQGEEYNAVKMKVLRVKNSRPSTLNEGPMIASLNSSAAQSPTQIQEAEFRRRRSSSAAYRKRSTKHVDPYTKISYVNVFNAVLWFHIASWAFIASLFWTEFIPGFGIGKNGESPPTLLSIVWQSFDRCFHDGCSWWLITALFVYTQSFTYVILLTQSSMLAICTSCFGFPIIGIWWSIFQVNTHNWFIWMPVYTGELVCSVLGLPLILAGTVYLFKLDVLTSSNSNKNPTSGTQGKTLASTLQRHQHEQLRC